MYYGFKKYPIDEVYRLIEPGPVVLLSSADKDKVNVMTMSWLTMLEFEPPLVGCVISERNYSFEMVLNSGECVIGIPTAALLSKVVQAGNTSGRYLNKFEKFGLTPLPASKVRAPMIDECFVNLECRISSRALVKKFNFFIFEVTNAWKKPLDEPIHTIHHMGKGVFMISGKIVRKRSAKR